ncbi:YncE family protein [Plantactinospora sp. CA-294935]|uniref:YncE family protein n=1 Tax=Plantactinospora sp. CA-294935 TaxID=3240012 RepID=UPI003D9005CE
MRRFPLRAIAGSAVAAMVIAATGAPAQADDDRLPLPNYGDIVVDDVHDRVFVSGGPTTNGIVVTDFSGRVKKTITGQPGATGLALSADSTTLYAALASGDAISAIDTTTYAETARYPVGSQTCPTHLARTGTTIWFGYGCETDWTGKIGALDTAATPPTITLDRQGGAIFQRAPLLGAVTADAGPLVAGQLSLSLSTVRVFSVAGVELTEGATGDVVGSSLADLALSPDGATLFTASGSRDHAEAFAPADLARRGAYATGFRPNSVTVSPDSRYLAIGRNTSGREDVLVYEVGGVLPEKRVDLNSGEVAATRGLAWSGDLKYLFVVTQQATSSIPALEVVSRPTG